jgi:hypothetical protein
MRFYWSLNGIPEYAQAPKADRKRLWRAAYMKSLRHTEVWVTALGMGVCAAIGNQVGGVIGGGIGGGLGGLVYGQVSTHVTLKYFCEALGTPNDSR